MPIDAMLVSVCGVAVFAIFAAVLPWGGFQTRPKQLAVQSASTPTLLILHFCQDGAEGKADLP